MQLIFVHFVEKICPITSIIIDLIILKRGNVIEFRPGLFGIQPPENIGIILQRITRKKEVYVETFTTKGVKELRLNQLTKRSFPDKMDIPFSLPSNKIHSLLQPKLQDLINQVGKKSSSVINKQKYDSSETIYPPNDENHLWRFVSKEFSESQSVFDIARKWFREEPTTKQLQSIEEILEKSKPHGLGYFEFDANSKLFTALSNDEYTSIKDEIKELERIRARMVEKEEYEDEDGNIQVRYIPVGLKYCGFNDDDWEIVKRMQLWMSELIQTKTIRTSALGNTTIHTIDKFSLPQFLRYLAQDWTGTSELLQPDSAMVEFLLQTNYISESDSLELLAKRAVHDYPNFSWDVDEEIQKIALELPNPEDEPESYNNRRDLSDLLAYTVDPATARDFDQALSYEQHEDGTFTLWVHIADVTHYVRPGTLLDDYAKQRATSVYLPSRVLPMHPPALSTGLCALKENVDRFAITCQLSYTADGNTKDKPSIYLSIVHVKANLSYEYVDEKLEENDSYWIGMLQLGNLLRAKFIGLDIETKEARLSSTQGSQLGFRVEEASPSTNMNEIFMIRANEAIAEFLKESELPGLYRSHPIPDTPDVEKFNDQMAALGIDYELTIPQRPNSFTSEQSVEVDVLTDESSVLDMLKGGGKLTLMPGGFTTKKNKKDKNIEKEKEKEEEKTKEKKKPLLFGLAHLSETEVAKWMEPFKGVLNEVRKVDDKSDRMVMMLTTLGMFGRAYYTPDNIGHFGLGSRCYTHFTAPIRRYSDIVVHRVLKGILTNEATKDNPVFSEEDLDSLAEYITDQSYDAETLERRVVGAGLAMMTRRDEWKDLIGVVTRVSPRMVSVVIRDVLDGRIRISDLSKQEVIVDPSESIAFIKRDEETRLRKILNSSDWLEMLDEEDEPIEVLIRLGDKKAIKIVARDYIDGKVTVIPS